MYRQRQRVSAETRSAHAQEELMPWFIHGIRTKWRGGTNHDSVWTKDVKSMVYKSSAKISSSFTVSRVLTVASEHIESDRFLSLLDFEEFFFEKVSRQISFLLPKAADETAFLSDMAATCVLLFLPLRIR